MALNLNDKQSLQAEVVDFLCQHLYVGNITNSKKILIRARFNDGRKKGNLRDPIRRKNRLYVDNRDFFGWACKQKGWEDLKKIHDIHKKACNHSSATKSHPVIDEVARDLKTGALQSRVMQGKPVQPWKLPSHLAKSYLLPAEVNARPIMETCKALWLCRDHWRVCRRLVS